MEFVDFLPPVPRPKSSKVTPRRLDLLQTPLAHDRAKPRDERSRPLEAWPKYA